MPNYDEFGRPIYETAEEYNKAHKRGSYRTYDSPEGDAYVHKPMKKAYHAQRTVGQSGAKKGLKKSKLIIIGVAIYFIVMMVFLLFHIARSSFVERYEEAVPEHLVVVGDEDEDFEEYIGDDSTPLPEGFETFSYNGQTYSLPTTMEEIFQMGFVLEEEYDENDMMPAEYEETMILNDKDGYMAAMIQVCNDMDEEIPLSKCRVNFFYVENSAAYDEEGTVPVFVFGDGLTFESIYEEIEAYFGVPYYHYQDHSEDGYFYDSYQWEYYGEEEVHFVSITFWNGVIADVGIEKRIMAQ